MNYIQLGINYYNEKKFDLAKEQFLLAVKQEPNNLLMYHNLGVTCVQLGNNEEAIEWLKVGCQHGNADSFLTRGAAYRNIGEYDLALKDFGTAFILEPDNGVGYSNYSNTLREFGKPELALDFIKIANRLKPDNTSLLNESIIYLSLGNFTEGWKKYDYRWFYETGESLKPVLPGIEYDGSQNIRDKSILVYHEQGFGDCIQFGRFIKLLQDESARVIILCKEKLYTLFKYNFPDCQVISWTNSIPHFEYHVALCDLPRCFDITIDTIPHSNGYFSVDESCKSNWRKILGPKHKPRIGINWTSNGAAYNTKFRRIELQELTSLIDDRYEWINLHFDPTVAEHSLLTELNITNLNPHLGDFYTTAGLMTNLDCVITVDTVTAHLAGALGVSTFVMLPNYGCDWRWFYDREDSPFYSSIRLFRKMGNNWDSVINSLRLRLENIT